MHKRVNVMTKRARPFSTGSVVEYAQPTLRYGVAQSRVPNRRHTPLNRLDSFTQREGAPSPPTYDGVTQLLFLSSLQHRHDSPLPTHPSRPSSCSDTSRRLTSPSASAKSSEPASRSRLKQATAMFRAQSNIFDDVVVKATDENLTSENWEYILVRLP
jgi:hypothetical protein